MKSYWWMRAMAGLLALIIAVPALAQDDPAYRLETVAEGLEYPWSIAFLPDGGMLVTERAGRLRLIQGGGLQDAAVTGLPDDIYVAGQGGLFDVALDSDFAENRVLYLSYAHGTSTANGTKVVRAVLNDGRLSDMHTIFTSMPEKATALHFGGRLLPLGDGTLFITLGDGARYREEAQNLASHLGKIVRIRTDGTIPSDNPFLDQGDARPEVWSYGHRNVQGIALDPDTGRIYAHEHGARGGDEVNLVQPGLNYGWPAITHGVDYSGAKISPYTALPGMEQPLLHWTPSIAPSGMAFYAGDLFPHWQGSLFVGALAGMKVQRVMLENGRVTGEETLFRELRARIRDVRMAPDGALYLLTDSPDGKVVRVVPE